MTDLTNVWVRAAGLELVRADQLVSLLIGDPEATGGLPARVMVLAHLPSEPPCGQLQLMALVAAAGRAWCTCGAISRRGRPGAGGPGRRAGPCHQAGRAGAVRVPGPELRRRPRLGSHDVTAPRLDRRAQPVNRPQARGGRLASQCVRAGITGRGVMRARSRLRVRDGLGGRGQPVDR